MGANCDLHPAEIKGLLKEVNLLTDHDKAGSDQLIKADALALTKWASGLVGALAASSSAAAVVAWAADNTVLAALAAGIVAVTVAVAGWIVTTDLRARADLQRARYEARQALLVQYLALVDDVEVNDTVVDHFEKLEAGLLPPADGRRPART